MPGFAPVDPKQSFPELEERVLARWREEDVFGRSLADRADAPVWSFYEGPPTANGRPGSHHVLARVFKDVYPRYKTMCGFRVPRKAGWDCHGLPVELEVEKQLGISSKQEIEEFGIAEFNQRCRESVFEYVEEWNRLTERIGFWIDLDDPYVTLEDDYIESVWWSLRKLWDEDRLYEGHKVVPYCPRCGTALSSHEVALGYEDVEDPSIYVRFPLLGDGSASRCWSGRRRPGPCPATRPSPSRPRSTYVRARLGDEVLILAEALVEKVLGEAAEILERMPGSDARRPPLRRPGVRISSDRERGRASRSSPATSSPPRTAPASSTSPPPSARTTTERPPRTGSSIPPTPAPSTTRSASTATSTSASPASRASSSRTPGSPRR